MNSIISEPLRKLHSDLFKPFIEFFNKLPAWHFRDKSGKHEFMEIEIIDILITPDPFPCIKLYVWPNGKPDED